MPPTSTRRKVARCSVPECTKQVQTRRLCKAHGGGVRCRGPNCAKLAQSRGMCVAHGGGRRCGFDGCGKLAQSKGMCLSHGGGRRCGVPTCNKFDQLHGYCKSHAKCFVAEETTTSSQPTLRLPRSTSNSKLALSFFLNPPEPSKEYAAVSGFDPGFKTSMPPTAGRLDASAVQELVVNPVYHSFASHIL